MKPRAPSGAPDLGAAVVAIVLGGWTVKVDAQADDGAFALFEAGTAGVVQLWTQHEGFLRAEARRLGIAPAWTLEGRDVYFGELCAAEDAG
jgi:hypothetical protein